MMNHILIPALAAFFLFTGACRKQETAADNTQKTTAVNGSSASIAWQECVELTDLGWTICFTGANEYRCPCTMECFWEGAVDGTFLVKTASGLEKEITLTTNSNPENLHQTETIEGKVIRFVKTEYPDGCEDYGVYEKYKAVIEVQ